MAAQVNENVQYTDESSGELLVNGYIYIGTAGLDAELNPITIYSDRELTTVLPNPQRTDADGRSVNKIWVDGRYSLKVTNSANEQKLNDLNLGGSSVDVGSIALSNVQGANAITAEASPSITALVDKKVYIFTAVADNTGPVALKIDTTPTHSVTKDHGQALVEGDIKSGYIVQTVWNAGNSTFELTSVVVVDTFPQRLPGLETSGFTGIYVLSLDALFSNREAVINSNTGSPLPPGHPGLLVCRMSDDATEGYQEVTGIGEGLSSKGQVFRRYVTAGAWDAVWEDKELLSISQAEAEAGVDTTNRLWSSLRVAQAVAAQPASSVNAPTMQIFTASGTWTKPAGVRSIEVTVVGKGGDGGSGASGSNNGSGSGGGGGGTAIKIIDVSAITSETVIIGVSASNFGAHCSASAGMNGLNSTGVAVAGGLGGVGSSGDINLEGGKGGYGRAAGGFGADTVAGHGGGSSSLGEGARCKPIDGVGDAGSDYGGGGSGGVGAGAGGSGAGGVVIVREFY